jgi:hypothetical protein
MTHSWYTGSTTTQTDIVFNNTESWNVYSDSWRSPLWKGVADFQRVAVHELGHAIGLDHEDSGVKTIMTTLSGDIIIPQQDDINGVAALYGSVSNFNLVVTKSGSGTVTSVPSGINCGTACSASFASGTNVTLTAMAAAGWDFTGWSGGVCSGTSTTCQVSLVSGKTVTATFTVTDITGPIGTVTINGGATTTTNSSVTLSLSASDPSGVAEMRFSNDNVNWSTAEPYGMSKVWSLSSGDGSKTVYVRFKDGKGNWSTSYNAVVALSPTPTPTPTPTSSGEGGGGGGGCFIATAAYGSYFDPSVKILRNFKDAYLLTNHPGQSFVAWYYKVSPPIADSMKASETMKASVRILLLPAVGFAYLCLNAGVVPGLLIIIFSTAIICLGIRRIYRFRCTYQP